MDNQAVKNSILPMERFWLCLIFLFSVSIFNKGGHILMGLVVLSCLLYFYSIRIDLAAFWLILFSISYSIIFALHFGFSFTVFCNSLIGPWGAYLVGNCYTRRYGHGQPLLRLMLAVSLGFFVHGTLNLMTQLFVYFDPGSTFRMTYDIWHHRYISTTGAGLLYTLILGLAFGLLFSETKRRYKLLGFAAIGISFLYSVVLAHRTTAALIAMTMLLYLCRRLWNVRRITRGYVLAQMCGLFALLFFLICLLLDLYGLRSWIAEQSLYIRITDPVAANSGSRVAIWVSFLCRFWHYPMGGAEIPLARGVSYVHNMWLDVYYRCGILPFVALIGASCSILRQISLMCKQKKGRLSPITQNCLIFSSWTFALNAFVEPVMDANPYFLFGYLMIAGGLSGVSHSGLAGGTPYESDSGIQLL